MRNLLIVVIAALSLAACASQKKEESPVLPLPVQPAFQDPDNVLFMNAVSQFINAKGAPSNSRYEFTRIDLNGDKRRDGIVLMKSPHQYWCGANGCDMYVFMAADEHFELISTIAPVRGPIIISDNRTNGWKDMIIHVSGRAGGQTKDVVLTFNGQTYPGQPAFQTGMPGGYKGGGVRIFP